MRVCAIAVLSAQSIGATVARDGDEPAGALRVVLAPAGEWQAAPHGGGNVYAPEVRVESGVWRMWFGGQGKDGHDRIQLAESEDGVRWESRGVVLDREGANHVNDPSVVRVGDTYWMFYSRAESDIRDVIAVATSKDGVAWSRRGVALGPGRAGSWDALLVGRPSVLVEEGVFRMWYDGRKDLPPGAPAEGVPKKEGSVRAVGYAESRDGLNWVRPREAPVFGDDAGGVHVCRIGDRLVMVYESREGTRLAVSADGLKWKARGLLAARSGGAADRFGQVTPFLRFDPRGPSAVLFVGAAGAASWDRNAIARIRLTDEQMARIRED